MKAKYFLAQVVAGTLGAIVGGFAVGLVTQAHTPQFFGAAVGAVVAVRLLLRSRPLLVVLLVPGAARSMIQIWFRTPEGGKLPKGIPREARRVDHAMGGARVALRYRKPDKRPALVERARLRVRQEAKNATTAGQADAVREILRFREPCSGPPDIQEAWAQLLAAAREGIAEGETSDHAPHPAPG